jgi:hypothetical protein
MTEHNKNGLKMQRGELKGLQDYYLDLMQSCLTGSIYRDVSQAPFNSNNFDPELRDHGLDWPAQAQTMIGTKRMANLRALTESIIADNIPGDFIETGVWRGGACIFMRAILFAYNITERCVWVADSFEGLPAANELQYPEDKGSDFHTYGQLAISLDEVQENFRAYGLLDEQTKFLKGWFKDTLPTSPIEQLALIRLDGDMYESTMDGLTNLYSKLSHQGYIIIDDYHVVPACKAAVHDYCDAIGIQPEIFEIDGVGVYWRKIDPAKQQSISANADDVTISPDIQVNRLNEAIAGLSRNVMSYLQGALANRDGNIDRLNQELTDLKQQSLAERDAQIQQLTNLNQSLAERDVMITERDVQIAGLNESLAAHKGQITNLRTTLDQIYSSISWRMTKPLRAINKIIK